MLGLSMEGIGLCLVAVFLGSAVQGWIGIGMGMVASPFLTFVDPDFVPVAIIFSVIPLSGLLAWAERDHLDRRGLGIALAGRLPGVIIGALITAWLTDTVLALLVGGSVLLAVAASVSGYRAQPRDSILATAGMTSGFMATTTGIGGPPMALAYQNSSPSVMRGTISVYFTVGAFMSLFALIAAGEVSVREVELGLMLIPGVIAGLVVARLTRHRFDADVIRPLALAVCSVSAVGLLVKTFV